jgi:hypothetical protein
MTIPAIQPMMPPTINAMMKCMRSLLQPRSRRVTNMLRPAGLPCNKNAIGWSGASGRVMWERAYGPNFGTMADLVHPS